VENIAAIDEHADETVSGTPLNTPLAITIPTSFIMESKFIPNTNTFNKGTFQNGP
jgi:hypothetical protein